MKHFYTCLLLLLFLHPVQASQKRKVLFIGIAGIRSDALQKANTPVIDNVIANGFYTYTSWHRGHTLSAPAWSTIMCGVEYNKHKVEDNTYVGNNYANYPYFTTRAKSCLPNLYTAQIVQWAPMSDNPTNDGWNKKIKVTYGAGDQSVSAAQTQLAYPNLDVLFVCFDEADIVGHTTGFSPDNPNYIKALETIDGHVGSVLTALRNRGNYENEEWIVMLTTDYGAIGTTHGTNTDQERIIWWIGAGNRKGPRQAPGTEDPGSISIGNYDPVKGAKNPGQYDIAVTALDHLLKESPCIPTINPAWDLDGKSWLDSLHSDDANGIPFIQRDQLNVTVFPNPSSGLVSFWFENEKNDPVSFKLRNELGQEILTNTEDRALIYNNKFTIDLKAQPAGIYFVELLIGDKRASKKVVHR
jgi:hypothetical protein